MGFNVKKKKKKSNIEKKKKKKTKSILFSTQVDGHPVIEEILGNGESRVRPGKELLKWLFGFSHSTFPSIFLSLVQKISIKLKNIIPNAYLLNEGKKLKEEIDTLLKGNSIFVFPTYPKVAPKVSLLLFFFYLFCIPKNQIKNSIIFLF